MPHCWSGKRHTHKNNCKTIKKDLNELPKRLLALSQKHPANALRIKWLHVSLGEPRENYKPHYIGIDPILLQDPPNFTIHQSCQDTPLLLYGSDDGIIAARLCLKDSMLGLLTQVSATIDTAQLLYYNPQQQFHLLIIDLHSQMAVAVSIYGFTASPEPHLTAYIDFWRYWHNIHTWSGLRWEPQCY